MQHEQGNRASDYNQQAHMIKPETQSTASGWVFGIFLGIVLAMVLFFNI